MSLLFGFLFAALGVGFYKVGRRDGENQVLQGMSAFFLRGTTSITFEPGAMECLKHKKSQTTTALRWGKDGMEIVVKEYLGEISDMGAVQIVSGKDGSLILQRKGNHDAGPKDK